MNSAEVMKEAGDLAARGCPDEAIDMLTAANRESRSVEIERLLVRLRHESVKSRQSSVDRATATARAEEILSRIGRADDPFPEVRGKPPEVTPSQLTSELVRGAIQHHGSLVVRGFIEGDRADLLAKYTDFALESAAKLGSKEKQGPDEWYAPLRAEGVAKTRNFARATGTLYGGDCPRVFFELLEVFRETGIDRLSSEYFGERTTVSLQKFGVRKVSPEPFRGKSGSMWHQDGRFLGEGVRALNLWIALTDAGVDSPGIKVVPRRLDTIVPSGTDTAAIEWCVGERVVDEVAGDTPPVMPEFKAGDALIFDELNLHSTAVRDSMTQPRISTETWFFAESTFPTEKWVPLSL